MNCLKAAMVINSYNYFVIDYHYFNNSAQLYDLNNFHQRKHYS